MRYRWAVLVVVVFVVVCGSYIMHNYIEHQSVQDAAVVQAYRRAIAACLYNRMPSGSGPSENLVNFQF